MGDCLRPRLRRRNVGDAGLVDKNSSRSVYRWSHVLFLSHMGHHLLSHNNYRISIANTNQGQFMDWCYVSHVFILLSVARAIIQPLTNCIYRCIVFGCYTTKQINGMNVLSRHIKKA